MAKKKTNKHEGTSVIILHTLTNINNVDDLDKYLSKMYDAMADYNGFGEYIGIGIIKVFLDGFITIDPIKEFSAAFDYPSNKWLSASSPLVCRKEDKVFKQINKPKKHSGINIKVLMSVHSNAIKDTDDIEEFVEAISDLMDGLRVYGSAEIVKFKSNDKMIIEIGDLIEPEIESLMVDIDDPNELKELNDLNVTINN